MVWRPMSSFGIKAIEGYNMENNKKINATIDIFKFIAAICVVAIHTNAFKDVNECIYNFLSHCVFTFAVPFFFISSGFFLGKKVRKTSSESDYRTVLKTYFLRLFYPYIIWGTWYFFISIVINVISNNTSILNAIGYQLHVWFVSSPGGGLWYIQSILFLLIILYLDGSKTHIPYVAAVFFILSCVPDSLLLLSEHDSFVNNVTKLYNEIFITELNFAWWGLYFLLGLFFGYSGFKLGMVSVIKKYKTHLLVLFYVIYASVYVVYGDILLLHILKIIVSVLLFSFTIINTELHISESKSVFIRKMSTVIYFSHFSFIYAVQVVFKVFDMNIGNSATLAWIIASICVTAYSYFVLRIRGNPLLHLYEKVW